MKKEKQQTKFIHDPRSTIHHPFNKGFTLIEILVTATIISLLAAIGIASYASINRNSRDARRKADLEQVRAALEIYRADEGAYIVSGWASLPSSLEPDYIQDLPEDPKNTADSSFTYKYSGDATTYCLEAQLENSTLTTNSCGSDYILEEGFNYGVGNP